MTTPTSEARSGPTQRRSHPSPTERPLRICYVSADYPMAATAKAGSGGIGTHTFTLAHAVADLGHRVVVLTESADGPDEYFDGPVHVHALRNGPQRSWKLGRWIPVPWLRRSIAVWRELRRLHRQHPFDVVSFPDGYGEGLRYSYSPLAPYAVQLFGPASLVQQWDGRHVPSARARVEAWIERRAASRAALFICATRQFAGRLVREWALDPGRVRIIRNPLDLELFRPGRGDGARPKTVLFVGHLQRLKGLETLAAAIPLVVQRHPEARFRLVGNDTKSAPGNSSMRYFLQRLLAERGLAAYVTFVDPVPQPDLVSFYQQCDAFVLPSITDVYPNAVLEAMACGRPCVVTNTVGVAEIISNGESGFVIPPEDPEALAGAICRVLDMAAAQREEIGRRARLTVEQLCARHAIATQTIDAYREVLAVASPAADLS